MFLRSLPVLDGQQQLIALVQVIDAQRQLLPRFPAAFHPLGQRHFFLCRQQRNAPDLLEVQADGVVDVDEVQVDIQFRRLMAFLIRAILVVIAFAERADLNALLEEIGKQIL